MEAETTTTKKRRGPRKRAGSPAPKPVEVTRYAIPANLPEDEKKLLDRARARIARFEKRMLALTRAAAERWVPEQSLYETDETSAVVFGDDEYADFLAHVEVISDALMLRLIGGFLGVKRETLDSVVHEKLRAKFVPQAQATTKGGAVPFVVRRGPRPNGEAA